MGRLKCKLAAGLKVGDFCNRSFNGDRPTQTHSRHTQSHADPSRARQARSGPSDPRSLPDPTDPPSEQASTTDHQPVLQPASPAPPARPESRPNPNLTRSFSSPAGRPQSRSSARPRKGGAPTGGASDAHAAHSPTHTHSFTHSLTHSLTPSRRDGRGRRALTAACCPPRTPRLLPGRPTLRRPPRRRVVPVSPPGASE